MAEGIPGDSGRTRPFYGGEGTSAGRTDPNRLVAISGRPAQGNRLLKKSWVKPVDNGAVLRRVQREPLDDGTVRRLGSRRVASSRALPHALKTASRM